jgi:hypothetical protein
MFLLLSLHYDVDLEEIFGYYSSVTYLLFIICFNTTLLSHTASKTIWRSFLPNISGNENKNLYL